MIVVHDMHWPKRSIDQMLCCRAFESSIVIEHLTLQDICVSCQLPEDPAACRTHIAIQQKRLSYSRKDSHTGSTVTVWRRPKYLLLRL